MITERKMYGGRGQGSLIRYSNSPFWYSVLRVRGREVCESTKTEDLKVARRIHKQRLDAVALDRQGVKPFALPLAQRVTVAELLDDWQADIELRELKSAYKALAHAKPIRAHFGTWRAVDVDAAAVDRYVEQCRATGLAAATCNRRVQCLASAFKLGVERKRVTSILRFRKLSEAGNQRLGFFERPDFERLLAALPEYLKDAAQLAYVTGWRKGEIVSLKWSMVNLTAGTITIPTSKNGEARTIPVVGGIAEILRRREAERLVERDGQPVVADYVFHRNGRCLGDFKRAWNRARIAAGLPDGLVHDLRRTAVRNFEQAGVPRSVAMKITGHKTESVYRRYAIVSSGDMKRALEQVSA